MYFSTDEHPITRLMRYVESIKGKADVLIRAQSGVQNMTEKLTPDYFSTEEEAAEIVRLAHEGVFIRDISAKMGRSKELVRRVLGERGIDMRHLAKPFANQMRSSPELGLQILNIIKDGKSFNHAVQQLKVTQRVGYESMALAGGYARINKPVK